MNLTPYELAAKIRNMEFDQGRDAARHLWKEGLSGGTIDDPIHPEFARGALEELEELQKGTPGILKEVLVGPSRCSADHS